MCVVKTCLEGNSANTASKSSSRASFVHFVHCFKSVRPAYCVILYTNIDQTLMNSLHRLLNCEI